MYKKIKAAATSLRVNDSLQGETIEQKVRRITEQNESITDGAPTIFTDREEGVLPEHNIRTDRWELAVEAMDKVSQNKIAKREGAAQAAATEEGAQADKGKKGRKSSKGKEANGGTPEGGTQETPGTGTTE